eukprot:GAHX01000577.1.p1 GENE.GAHX01000577.1~~GAHX01000577.1.p1  ORF type:complete len:187 (+),score=32.80 GAHX01000577.1:55-561(+)
MQQHLATDLTRNLSKIHRTFCCISGMISQTRLNFLQIKNKSPCNITTDSIRMLKAIQKSITEIFKLKTTIKGYNVKVIANSKGERKVDQKKMTELYDINIDLFSLSEELADVVQELRDISSVASNQIAVKVTEMVEDNTKKIRIIVEEFRKCLENNYSNIYRTLLGSN